MKTYRSVVVNWARACLGIKEGTPSHKNILGTYNGYANQKKLPTTGVNDAWCMTFASACFIASGYSELIPCENGCQRAINKSKSMGIWVEADNFIPSSGDLIFYDWDDNGKGDCVGWADHVGIVEQVQGKNIIVIEGNKNNKVDRRNIAVNSRYIRGFITPRFTNA